MSLIERSNDLAYWFGDLRRRAEKGEVTPPPSCIDAIQRLMERTAAEQLEGAVDVLRKIAADEGVVHDGIIDTDVPRQTAQAYLDALGGQ